MANLRETQGNTVAAILGEPVIVAWPRFPEDTIFAKGRLSEAAAGVKRHSGGGGRGGGSSVGWVRCRRLLGARRLGSI
jgi:hypothetical protein